jgi:AcrR family transcriptional regulator
MTRTVKEYAVRRDEILDAAERLIYSRGYDQMTIADILGELQIAKGTFYHYFESKQALLEAITARMMTRIEQLIAPLVEAPQVPALEKLQRFFTSIARWESGQKGVILALLSVWYRNDNAIVREKVRIMTLRVLAPPLTRIIHQGVTEGTLATPYPDQAGEIMLTIIQGLEESVAWFLLAQQHDEADFQRMQAAIAAAHDALDRVVGSPPGTLHIVDFNAIREWLVLPADGGEA